MALKQQRPLRIVVSRGPPPSPRGGSAGGGGMSNANDMEAAATKVQASFRGSKTRKELKVLLIVLGEEGEEEGVEGKI